MADERLPDVRKKCCGAKPGHSRGHKKKCVNYPAWYTRVEALRKKNADEARAWAEGKLDDD